MTHMRESKLMLVEAQVLHVVIYGGRLADIGKLRIIGAPKGSLFRDINGSLRTLQVNLAPSMKFRLHKVSKNFGNLN